jgi:glyoxylase-like metal-dependent hydrolase (beta-lactamase superfamily II)
MTVEMSGMEITSVLTSRFRLDGGSMFGVIPKVLWEAQSSADDLNRIYLNVNALLVRTGGQVVLVEPGMGQKYDEKRRRIYALDALDAAGAIQEAGVDPGQVDIILPTHLHLDHVGGSTYRDEAGIVAPTFPHAVCMVQEKEWATAIAPGPLERGSYNPADFVPLEESGLLRIISGDVEVAPGISVELTGGHTSGHQVVRLRSSGDEAVFLGDIVPTAAHLRLNWLMAWDMEPRVVYEAKERLLTDAASRGVLCFFAHDPRIAGCRLEHSDGGFRPIEGTIIEAEDGT